MKFLSVCRVFVLTCAAGAGLVGCATAPGAKFSEVREVAPNTASVYVYRKDRAFASGQSFDVLIDKKVVGEIVNASFLTLDVAPGTHKVAVKPQALAPTFDREVTMESGKTYFFEFDMNGGLLANIMFVGSTLVEQPKEKAIEDLKLLKGMK